MTHEDNNNAELEILELAAEDVEAVSGGRMKLVSAVPPVSPPDPHSGGATGYTLVFRTYKLWTF